MLFIVFTIAVGGMARGGVGEELEGVRWRRWLAFLVDLDFLLLSGDDDFDLLREERGLRWFRERLLVEEWDFMGDRDLSGVLDRRDDFLCLLGVADRERLEVFFLLAGGGVDELDRSYDEERDSERLMADLGMI